jgi:hypothetical protein
VIHSLSAKHEAPKPMPHVLHNQVLLQQCSEFQRLNDEIDCHLRGNSYWQK